MINPANAVYTDRITPHLDANAPMIVTAEGQMNVEGDTRVLAGKKLYVSEIRTASQNSNPTDNNITLVGNVRVQGNFRIGESNGDPHLTTMLAERPVNGAIAQLIAGTLSL